ncbi:DEP domain-containing protein 1B-like [Myxocyprinus asiaticus]|uniref:DEP domain-containing protein 1B-like n=1 Tax=Myxocyprinus asiaticus TaxID=70543 RepID=UPI002223E6F5|nr:DEP domain-containing protein 1B-like [Myxocyprinus asiaticus]XP_051541797.1 DEP domain-containing protein 1B-like [Myxocyprinus asiaticus]
MIGPGPYRATKLWNETIKLFRGGMPVRRHWAHFRSYDRSFTGAEAVDFLHELLIKNQNFGLEVTRYQTLQLLRKFIKNHVIEDVKGQFGKEDFEDNGHLYRFPPQSPLKPLPVRPPVRDQISVPRIPCWDDYENIPIPVKIPMKPLIMNSGTWNKRHSIAIGELPECKLIRRGELSPKHVDQTWKSMTLTHLQTVLGLQSLDGVLDAKLLSPKHIVHNVFGINKQGIVILKNNAEDLPHWVLSAMKCLANWPNGSDSRQPMYPGFEREVFRTVAEHFQRLKEPLLTFHLYEILVSILGLLQQPSVAVEALQVCCLLLPPANRRKLQLLMRLMAKVCANPTLPPLNNTIGARTLMVQTFSRCILGSADEVDLDELLATKLVTFMIDNHNGVLKVPSNLRKSVEEHLSHLRRAQIKYAGADTDTSMMSPPHLFCRQVSREEFEEQRVSGSHGAVGELLENIIKDKNMSIKDKKKKLKQFQRSHPEIYCRRFPTSESEAALFPEKPQRIKPQLMSLTLKKPFQPFQRSWSFRA